MQLGANIFVPHSQSPGIALPGRTGLNLLQLDTLHHLEDPGVDGRIILRWIFRK
jgi:hypothetical protein